MDDGTLRSVESLLATVELIFLSLALLVWW